MIQQATPGQDPPAVGRIGCPIGQEANVDEFYFWVADGHLVEQTQIVRVSTPMGGEKVELFGVVEQVYRRSSISSMQMEVAAHDGDPVADDLLLDPLGVTYAKARVVNTFPTKLAPPLEGSTVFSCSGSEVERAYEIDQYAEERGICVGLIRNGGDSTAGRAYLDPEFLLGSQSGHLNVNGAAGSGTKSSFLTLAAYQTINAVKARTASTTGSGHAARIKAIIFNVKGFDLFWLDRWSTQFRAEDLAAWTKMGVSIPGIFHDVRYYAPESAERSGHAVPIENDRPGDVVPYSWSLSDVIEMGLFEMLFSDETRANDNMVTLINILNRTLSAPRSVAISKTRASFDSRMGLADDDRRETRRQLSLGSERAFDPENTLARTFDQLLAYIEKQAEPDLDELSEDALRNMNKATLRAIWRRLTRSLKPGSGLLRREESDGLPLLLANSTEAVSVVDLHTIRDTHLQRFVIAAVLNQLVDWRSGASRGGDEKFLVVIDELNQYAPRGASDPITRLFEYVASQMRSRGIILFGAQQQGSRVSEVVIENSQTRVLGRSGGQELADPIWRGFAEGDRKLAVRLDRSEKIIVAPNFREALHVKVPRPPWAMRREEATVTPPAFVKGAEAPRDIGKGRSNASARTRRKARGLEV